jgi:hypothetical protein
LLACSHLFGQCDNNLVELAMAQSGKDAVFVREFKVQLQKGTVRNPVPTVKFNVYLKEEVKYRFNIINDKSSGSEAILQLFQNGKCVGSTFEEGGNHFKQVFEYDATKTGSYHVIVSFRDGKAGCAAGIMSMVSVDDASADSVRLKESVELETLYLQVENPVSIVTDKEVTDTLIVEIDNGNVFSKEGYYFIEPQSEGLATLKVIIKNQNGKVKEEAKSDFLVRRMPLPRASLQGQTGGVISRSSLQLADMLNIDTPLEYEKFGYQLVDFVLRTGDKGEKRITNTGKKFNPMLRNFLADLPEETRIVIESIHVKKPDGQVITLEPLAFIIR